MLPTVSPLLVNVVAFLVRLRGAPGAAVAGVVRGAAVVDLALSIKKRKTKFRFCMPQKMCVWEYFVSERKDAVPSSGGLANAH